MSEQARALIDSTPDQIATAGASASFDEAFTLHHRAVFRAACAVLRDSALAEDVTQEVFLKLYRGFDSTPAGELLRPWLLRVSINAARNTIRGQNRSRARDTDYEKDVHGPGWIAPEKDYERRVDLEGGRPGPD